MEFKEANFDFIEASCDDYWKYNNFFNNKDNIDQWRMYCMGNEL